MIGVIVRDDHAVDVVDIPAEGGQAILSSYARNTGVEQKPGPIRLDIYRVAVAAGLEDDDFHARILKAADAVE